MIAFPSGKYPEPQSHTNADRLFNRNDPVNPNLTWKDVPTFEAIVKRPELFQALVCCLAKRSSTADNTEISAPINRIRSMSVTEPSLRKNGASPLPPQRNAYETNKKKPVFDEPLFAATVLFSVFQHLKHWPVPLVKAYADDSFGPRLWVDNPRCSLFVKNLALAHKEAPCPPILFEEERNDARLIAQTYKTFYCLTRLERHAPIEHQLSSSSLGTERSVKRQASATSIGSSSGENGIAVKRPRVSSPNNGDSAEKYEEMSFGQSTSGDDVVHSAIKRKRDTCDQENNDQEQPNDSKSSSSMEDEDAGDCDDKNRPSYPLDFSSIQPVASPIHRFIGSNIELAHEMIAMSLEERLDVKAKQNSGLLQCLPDFVSIPAVREQVSANIERWLQSPALAGLARVLLGETVKRMENANPPLREDLKVVDAVLGMKLKTNQASHDVDVFSF
jgi:integrator complex subunit 1